MARPGSLRSKGGLGLVALLLLGSCGKVKTPTEPPGSGPGSGPVFSFARVQAEIFTPNCAKAGCHTAAAASGGMVLEAGMSYAQIVGHRSVENPGLNRIQPGDPEHSYMVKKVRGDPDISGQRMPQDGPPYLSQAQIDGLVSWVQAGAPAN